MLHRANRLYEADECPRTNQKILTTRNLTKRSRTRMMVLDSLTSGFAEEESVTAWYSDQIGLFMNQAMKEMGITHK
eukprot:m.194024 g.194024  ORF g.194024 m.194024 type:complete len:76 (+) comp15197_c0_seq3:1255-1482(+)